MPGRAKRVLVVDDQEKAAQTLQRALSGFGHSVEVARDGIEALAKLRLRRRHFDPGLLDVFCSQRATMEAIQQEYRDPGVKP